MDIKLHSNASTTPRTRKYIQTSEKSDAELASELNISTDTVRRWRSRSGVLDKSHRPRKIHRRLTVEQELLILYIRQAMFLSLDELLEVTRLLINKDVSRAVLSRCLKKYNIQRIQKPKSVLSGSVVVDFFQLPESISKNRQFLMILIEQYSVHVSVALIDKADALSKDRLVDFIQHSLPYRIKSMQIPDDSFLRELAARLSVAVESSDDDRYMAEWEQMGVRFDGDISELLCGELFDPRLELGATLLEYEDVLNKSVIRNRLNKLTPAGYLKLHPS